MNARTFVLSLGICLSFCQLAAVSSALAAPLCSDLLQSEYAVRDSSVEVELPVDRSIVLVTTEDGTLRGLFKKESDIPAEVLEHIQKKPSTQPPLEASFDDLPIALRIKALSAGIISKKMVFGTSAGGHRQIPGIKVKETYQKSFQMTPGIDLAAASTVKDGKMIEFHIRSNKKPGLLALQAAALEKQIGVKPGPMHMHVLFNLMVQWLHENPEENSWRLIEFWRRANLALEMRDVVDHGRGLINNTTEFEGSTYTNFSPLAYSQVSSAFNYFRSVGHQNVTSSKELDANTVLKSRAKMGWIGAWGHDKYDAPDLFGFELRFLDGSDLPPQMVEFLNNLHDQLENHNFGMDPAILAHWGEVVQYRARQSQWFYHLQTLLDRGEDFPSQLDFSYYRFLSPHRSYEDLMADLPFAMKQVLLGMDAKKVKAAIEERGRLRYLLHDWSMDPLLFQNPEMQIRVANAQLKALRRWGQGVNETEVIQEFLIESELYQLFADSISMRT